MSIYGIVAVCVCGERTCTRFSSIHQVIIIVLRYLRCHLREHLPISCSDYNRWLAMFTREGENISKLLYHVEYLKFYRYKQSESSVHTQSQSSFAILAEGDSK